MVFECEGYGGVYELGLGPLVQNLLVLCCRYARTLAEVQSWRKPGRVRLFQEQTTASAGSHNCFIVFLTERTSEASFEINSNFSCFGHGWR